MGSSLTAIRGGDGLGVEAEVAVERVDAASPNAPDEQGRCAHAGAAGGGVELRGRRSGYGHTPTRAGGGVELCGRCSGYGHATTGGRRSRA